MNTAPLLSAVSSSPRVRAAERDVPPATAAAAGPGARLMSLDALRGFDMFWIIGATAISDALLKMKPSAVTTAIATQLQHVRWEGFHFYDLIFPLFLFIVGVSTVFSLGRHTAEAEKGPAVKRILLRGFVLYLLGIFYHGGLSERWPNIQFSGVLQRIAACYVAAALLFLFLRLRPLIVTCVALLVGYWALLTYVPFPDLRFEASHIERLAVQVGSNSPSAIAAAVPERVRGVYEEGRNLTNYLDFRFLPGRKPIGRYYINEGLLSTLPAISITLCGIFAGLLLRSGSIDGRRKAAWLFGGGLIVLTLGLLWSLQFPLIKRIWSSSFCLTATGCSAMAMAVFHLVVDVWQARRWCQPFVWIGMNAITIYLAMNVLSFSRIAERLVGGDVKSFLDVQVAAGLGALVVALVSLALAVGLTCFLHRRRIFLRV